MSIPEIDLSTVTGGATWRPSRLDVRAAQEATDAIRFIVAHHWYGEPKKDPIRQYVLDAIHTAKP